MAKADYDDLQNYYWMDAYAYGRYPRAAIQYLKSLGCAPIFEEGDEALMKKAASLIDFMGVNYYVLLNIMILMVLVVIIQ